MKRPVEAAAAVLLALTFLGSTGLLGQEDEGTPSLTVYAERYSFTTLNLDLGKEVEITDLWFREDGIVCSIVDPYGRTGFMKAVYGKPRDMPTSSPWKPGAGVNGRTVRPEGPSWERIEVPRKLYERIKRLADLSRQARRLSAELGTDPSVTRLFRKADEE